MDWAINMAKWCNGIKKQGSSLVTSYLWNHLQQNSLIIALPFLYFYLVFIFRILVIKIVTGISWLIILLKRSRIIKQALLVWQVAGFIKTGYPFYKYFLKHFYFIFQYLQIFYLNILYVFAGPQLVFKFYHVYLEDNSIFHYQGKYIYC